MQSYFLIVKHVNFLVVFNAAQHLLNYFHMTIFKVLYVFLNVLNIQLKLKKNADNVNLGMEIKIINVKNVRYYNVLNATGKIIFNIVINAN